MNRAIDSRSDLYALGVTFYQLLTGLLPFEADDAVGWVYCHVARKPLPPGEVRPSLPVAVSNIVLKLLAKLPDDRYQSALGLKHDLDRCLRQWQESGQIEPFPLGEHDVSNRFLIPQKLYGRERECAALHAAFEHVVDSGTSEYVLVSGYAGIGKSAIVHDLQRSIVSRRGLFAAGKFEQYKRDIPYSTIMHAFRGLVLDLMAESERAIVDGRERIQSALGQNGRLIVDLIPQVGLVIGPQPPVPALPMSEAEHRLRMVLRQFFSVFARPGQPLTVFFDDLQWADAASLRLLGDLVVHPEARHLLVIGAYRENEVDSSHPLMRILDEVGRSGPVVQRLVLGPLPVPGARSRSAFARSMATQSWRFATTASASTRSACRTCSSASSARCPGPTTAASGWASTSRAASSRRTAAPSARIAPSARAPPSLSASPAPRAEEERGVRAQSDFLRSAWATWVAARPSDFHPGRPPRFGNDEVGHRAHGQRWLAVLRIQERERAADAPACGEHLDDERSAGFRAAGAWK